MTHAPPPSAARRRWSATGSAGASSSLRARAAQRCASARSAAGSDLCTAAATAGCAKVSRSPPASTPIAASASASVATRSRLKPVRPAAWRSSASGPSTAAASSSAAAAGSIARARRITVAPTDFRSGHLDRCHRPRGRGHARRRQLAAELADQPGTAAAGLVKRGTEPIVGIREEGGAQPARGALGAERLDGAAPRRGMRQHLVEDVAAGAGHGGATGDEQRHRHRLEAPDEIEDEAQGGRVGHVQVVDHEHERLIGGEVCREPVEAVHERAGGFAVTGGRAGFEERQRSRRRTRHQQLALAGARGREAGLEELERHAQLQLALVLASRRREQPQSAVRRGPSRRRQQRGLPAPVAPHESHGRAAPRRESVERALQQGREPARARTGRRRRRPARNASRSVRALPGPLPHSSDDRAPARSPGAESPVSAIPD